MKDYIVIKKGCCIKTGQEEEIGAKVKLSDEKAAGLVNKVELLKDYQLAGKTEQELIKENAKLSKRIKQLESLGESNEELDKLKADGEVLKAQGEALAGENAKSAKQNAKLVKQVAELTAQLDEATKPTQKD